MTNYGFSKKSETTSSSKMDLTKLPTTLPSFTPAQEREAIKKGERLGFTDRGQARISGRRRKAQETANLYVKGPIDTIEWLIQYTEDKGHSAYWRSIEDFRKLVEQQ
jgi:hypothetical protein